MRNLNQQYTKKIIKILNERHIGYAYSTAGGLSDEWIYIKKYTPAGLVYIKVVPEDTINGYGCLVTINGYKNQSYNDSVPLNEFLDGLFGQPTYTHTKNLV